MGSLEPRGFRFGAVVLFALRAIGLLGIARDFRSFRAERETGPA